MRHLLRRTLSLVPALAVFVGGCAFLPEGEPGERAKVEEAGRVYAEERERPELPASPGPMDYLRHAFLANADLEARYYEWKAALEQIPQDSSLPNLALSLSYMFAPGNMKAWDRTTVGLSSETIPFPSKLEAAGRVALEAARTAGEWFRAAKFELQGEVLAAYGDFALLSESIRIREESVALLAQSLRVVESRVLSGTAAQEDLLRLQTELELEANDYENLRSQVKPAAARLNALIGRSPELELQLPAALPEPRPVPVADADLLRLGAERSAPLAALDHVVAGRREALDLAKKATLPDFSISLDFTGSTPTLGGMLVLPTRVQAIRAGIAQAEANLRSAAAAREQYALDLDASFVLNLRVLRNDERQIALFTDSIIPRARETVDLVGVSLASGRAGYLDVLEAQRTLLGARLTLARLRTEREQALAAIETFAAVDVETLGGGAAVRGLRMP